MPRAPPGAHTQNIQKRTSPPQPEQHLPAVLPNQQAAGAVRPAFRPARQGLHHQPGRAPAREDTGRTDSGPRPFCCARDSRAELQPRRPPSSSALSCPCGGQERSRKLPATGCPRPSRPPLTRQRLTELSSSESKTLQPKEQTARPRPSGVLYTPSAARNGLPVTQILTEISRRIAGGSLRAERRQKKGGRVRRPGGREQSAVGAGRRMKPHSQGRGRGRHHGTPHLFKRVKDID